MGGDNQGWHHATVHVLLHLVNGAAKDDLTWLGVEGSRSGKAVCCCCGIIRRLVRLAWDVALEARWGWGIGGVPSIVVGVVVSVIVGLLVVFGAVVPVVVVMQQRAVQVVGLCGTCNLHGEAFTPLGT